MKSLHWPLIIGLGALALIRPLVSIVASQSGTETTAVVPVGITIAVSGIWIAIVGFSRVRDPFLTLVLTGTAYGVFSIALSAVLSPILSGQLQGPLANPIAIVPTILVSAIWGAIAGALALLVQRARGVTR